MNPAYDLQLLSDYLLQQRRADDRRQRLLRETLQARKPNPTLTREPLATRLARALRVPTLFRRTAHA